MNAALTNKKLGKGMDHRQTPPGRSRTTQTPKEPEVGRLSVQRGSIQVSEAKNNQKGKSPQCGGETKHGGQHAKGFSSKRVDNDFPTPCNISDVYLGERKQRYVRGVDEMEKRAGLMDGKTRAPTVNGRVTQVKKKNQVWGESTDAAKNFPQDMFVKAGQAPRGEQGSRLSAVV